MDYLVQGINRTYKGAVRHTAFLVDINGETIGSLIMWSNDNWYGA